MRQNYFLKAAFTLLMCGSITLASAKDIYLSNAGVDTNDGESAGLPVKTLCKAFSIAQPNDVIHVMNMININEEPTSTLTDRTAIDLTRVNLEKKLIVNNITYYTWNLTSGKMGILPPAMSLTLIGDDKATCGFDGNGTSCIIRQDHGGTGTATITYRNLTFQNGKSNDNSGGGAVYVRLSNIAAAGQAANFYNCDFIANKGANDKPGGAIAIVQQPGVVNFKLCRFAQNIASKGAAIYLERGTVGIDSCVFENHDLSVASLPHLTSTAVAPATVSPAGASVGAAIHTNLASNGQTISLDVKNTLFKNNKSGANGGAFSTAETNPLQVLTGTQNIKFTNCAFVNNTAGTGLGGAAYIHNSNVGTTQNVTFVNTTFNGNMAGSNTGGALAVNGLLVNSKFNLINTTISGNKVAGVTGAGGAGVRILKGASAGVTKIQNCILENNTAVDANLASAIDYADLGIENVVNVDLTTSPSYVAGTSLIIDKSLIGKCDNTDFSTQFPTNNTNYVFELNGSIVNSYVAKLGAFDEDKNIFPLLAGSPAIAYGNTSYLKDLSPSIITDQLGTRRPWTNSSAGAFEFTDASGVKLTTNNAISLFRNANNQLVVKNTADNTGTITVCNMMGQVVATAQMVGASTTINKAIKAGVYVVMVLVDGKVSTQKVILN